MEFPTYLTPDRKKLPLSSLLTFSLQCLNILSGVQMNTIQKLGLPIFRKNYKEEKEIILQRASLIHMTHKKISNTTILRVSVILPIARITNRNNKVRIATPCKEQIKQDTYTIHKTFTNQHSLIKYLARHPKTKHWFPHNAVVTPSTLTPHYTNTTMKTIKEANLYHLDWNKVKNYYNSPNKSKNQSKNISTIANDFKRHKKKLLKKNSQLHLNNVSFKSFKRNQSFSNKTYLKKNYKITYTPVNTIRKKYNREKINEKIELLKCPVEGCYKYFGCKSDLEKHSQEYNHYNSPLKLYNIHKPVKYLPT